MLEGSLEIYAVQAGGGDSIIPGGTNAFRERGLTDPGSISNRIPCGGLLYAGLRDGRCGFRAVRTTARMDPKKGLVAIGGSGGLEGNAYTTVEVERLDSNAAQEYYKSEGRRPSSHS